MSVRDEARRLTELAWPVSLGMLAQIGMGTVDTMMIGSLGERPLGALAIGNMWSIFWLIVGFGAVRALDPVVAQAFGAQDDDAVRRALPRGLVMAVLLAIPIGIGEWLAPIGLRWLGQPDTLIPGAAAYCRAVSVGVLPALLFSAGRQFLQALGIVRPATWAVLASVGLNVPLNAWLIHGGLGVPALGVVGCGIATSVANGFSCLALLWLCRDTWRRWWGGWQGAFAVRPLAELFAIGLPAGFQLGLEVWAFAAAGIMMGWIGETEVAAHAVAINLTSLGFMIPFGISAAAATRVGNLVGQRGPWRRAGWVALGMGGGVMCFTAAVYLSAPRALLSLYTDDPGVLAIGLVLLPIAGVFQVFDGVQVVAFGVLRGVGDVRVPTLANVLGHWVLGLPTGAWLAFRAGMGPVGVWLGLVVGLTAVSVMLTARVAQVGRREVTRVVA